MSSRFTARSAAFAIALMTIGPTPGQAAENDRFVFTQWSRVTPIEDWTFLTGDFTGDGRLDIAGYHPSNGSVWVGTNTGAGFSFDRWATLGSPAGWTLLTGHFAGDGKLDLVGYQPSDGSVWVGTNTGSRFDFDNWATLAPTAGWTLRVGQFSGDGLSDLVGYQPSNGTLHVGTNRGSSFEFDRWNTVSPSTGWTFHVGSFAGDGRADVLGYHPSDGSLWVGTNLGNRFDLDEWYSLRPAAGWSLLVGDFTGSAATDVFGYHPSNGTLWVGRNNGADFRFDRWATMDPIDGWQFWTGDFGGDAGLDVAGYHPRAYDNGSGSLREAINTGSAFALDTTETDTTDRPFPAAGWTFLAGHFAGDRKHDLVGYLPINGALWLGTNTGPRGLVGYAWPLSAAPGATIEFMASGEGRESASFSRHKGTARGIESTLVGGTRFDPDVQPVPDEECTTGCGWRASFELTIPDNWPSGIYSAKLTDLEGDPFHIPFIVKPALGRRSSVAVLANVNTWLAYDRWKNYGKYLGATHVSFLRPNPYASPLGGELHLTPGELWVLGWLQDEGAQPDVYTDIDFHEGGVHSKYKTLVLTTHPEYWTEQMYRNLQTFLDEGGSLLYLGGNGIFERGTYVDDGTAMEFGEKSARAEHTFRSLGLPERELLGVATQACGVAGAAYRVTKVGVGHPFLDGFRLGASLGTVGLNTGCKKCNGKASGFEVDKAFDDEDGISSCGQSLEGLTDVSQPPANIIILARAPEVDGSPGADMSFYEHEGGGFVFSAGSLTFGGSLVVDDGLQTIVRRALAEAARRAR